MTLRLVTGFEELPSSGINEARMGASGYYWFSNGDAMPAAETGRFGYGSCLHASLSGFSIPQMNMVRLTGVDVSQGFMGFAYKWEPTTSGFTYVSFFDAVNSAPCFTVSFGAFGIIRVWRGYPITDPAGGLGARGLHPEPVVLLRNRRDRRRRGRSG
jgi:hypothetical protein